MMTMTFSISRSYGLHISASRSLNDEPKKRNFIRIQFRRWYANNIKCFKLKRSWKRQKTVTAAPADKPWMTEKDKNQLLFCLHTFTFYDDRSLSSIILQWLNATRRCWSISPLNGWKRQKITTALSPHFHFRTGGRSLSSITLCKWSKVVSILLRDCLIRQFGWRVQILVTFSMGLWRILRLNRQVVSEFAFGNSPE